MANILAALRNFLGNITQGALGATIPLRERIRGALVSRAIVVTHGLNVPEGAPLDVKVTRRILGTEVPYWVRRIDANTISVLVGEFKSPEGGGPPVWVPLVGLFRVEVTVPE